MKLKEYLKEAIDLDKGDYSIRLSFSPISGISFDIHMPRSIRFKDPIQEKMWDLRRLDNKEEFKKLIDFVSNMFDNEEKSLSKEIADIMDTAMTLVKAKLQRSVLKMEKEFDDKVKKL
ncbi:MAG: hypothetical protein WC503_02975 [Candidatus Shapirobacteria bacterium]